MQKEKKKIIQKKKKKKENNPKRSEHAQQYREQLTEKKAAFRSHRDETKQRGLCPGGAELHSTVRVVLDRLEEGRAQIVG